MVFLRKICLITCIYIGITPLLHAKKNIPSSIHTQIAEKTCKCISRGRITPYNVDEKGKKCTEYVFSRYEKKILSHYKIKSIQHLNIHQYAKNIGIEMLENCDKYVHALKQKLFKK